MSKIKVEVLIMLFLLGDETGRKMRAKKKAILKIGSTTETCDMTPSM